jgi:hypothetical protein
MYAGMRLTRATHETSRSTGAHSRSSGMPAPAPDRAAAHGASPAHSFSFGNLAIMLTPPLMRKPTVGHPDDPHERAADAVADAVMSGGSLGGSRLSAASGVVQRKCEACTNEDEHPHGGASVNPLSEEDVTSIGGGPLIRRQPSGAPAMPDERSVAEAVRLVETGGTPLPVGVRSEMSGALRHRFDDVRIYTDERAGRAAQAVGARAFTIGNRIAFGPGGYAPETSTGRRLLAHELAHVVQQRSNAANVAITATESAIATTSSAVSPAATPVVQRQAPPPAAAPPVAPAPLLTDAQINTAITYNHGRFADPWTIATIRELIGIAKYPAVSDRDLAVGIAHWQDAHPPLTVDGQIGPATTKTIADQLGANGEVALNKQVRVDHTVSASANGPIVRTVPTPAVHGRFRLEASLNTTLRSGWIVQELRNTWNEVLCGGVANPGPPTPHYWEAWWVTPSGQVRIPTSLGTPPTHVAPAVAHDVWQRGLMAGTRGSHTMNANLFTTLTLPAGFAIRGVPDAGDLPSTVAAPNADALGLVEGTRHASSHWDGCPAGPNTHTA